MALVSAASGALVVASVNAAFEELMAITPIAAEGKLLHRLFRGTAASQLSQAVEGCLKTGEPVRLRIVHAPADRVIRLEIEIRRAVADGEAFAILSLSSIDRRLQLSELGEAGVLSELGALSRGLVFIRDVQRRRLRFGRHPLAGRLGIPEGHMALKHLRAIVHPDDLTRLKRFATSNGVVADEQVNHDTFRMRGVSGEWLWINIRSRAFTRNAAGEVVRLIGVMSDVSERHRYAIDMAKAAEALEQAEANERRRIGRELHDSTTQLLVAAQLGLVALERRKDDVTASELADVRQAIGDAQAEIRNFSYLLHPPSLAVDSLEDCLRAFSAGFARRTGLRITVKTGRKAPRLPPRVEAAFYRIAQEALMNVYRHANARTAQVTLKRDDGQAVLEIQDDGAGLRDPLGIPGVGLSGIQARMTQLRGTFTLDAERRRGLAVRVSVPLGPDPDL